MVNKFAKNARYLIPGNYQFDKTLNYIYYDDKSVKKKAAELFNNNVFFILSYKQFKKISLCL